MVAFDRDLSCLRSRTDLQTWCFTPRQPRRVISGRKQHLTILTTSKHSDSLSHRWGLWSGTEPAYPRVVASTHSVHMSSTQMAQLSTICSNQLLELQRFADTCIGMPTFCDLQLETIMNPGLTSIKSVYCFEQKEQRSETMCVRACACVCVHACVCERASVCLLCACVTNKQKNLHSRLTTLQTIKRQGRREVKLRGRKGGGGGGRGDSRKRTK